MNYVAGLLFMMLVTWGVYTSNPMFSNPNGPVIFRKVWGEALLGFLTLSVIAGAISGVVWMFSSFIWWLAVALILGGVTLGVWSHPRLPLIFSSSAIGLVASAFSLLGLHWLAWTALRP